MSNVFAIHSVGESLRTYLESAYPAQALDVPCAFELLSSGQISAAANRNDVLSLYLYRVTINEHLRNRVHRTPDDRRNVPLSVDLHYLLTAWSTSPFREHTILAWTMRELHQHPVLDVSSLSAEADWEDGDFVQMIPAELSTEDIMRIWDALDPSYRLSVSYIARVIRIDADPSPVEPPVVATRFSFEPPPAGVP